MNDRMVLKRLFWKELRQLLPLVVLLPAISVVVLALLLMGDSARIPRQVLIDSLAIVWLGMPGLFAVGAGPLLVGYEKEQRTIDWLASLPIAASRIVWVKLTAGVIGLLILWLLSGLMMLAVTSLTSAGLPTGIEWSVTPLHTLFLLLAGFALSWWRRSALAAVLLVFPVAYLPILVAMVVAMMAHLVLESAPIHPGRDTPPSIFIASQVVCCLIALAMIGRYGSRSLAAQASGSGGRWPGLASLDRYQTASRRAGYGVIRSPAAALIWQFRIQNGIVLTGASLLLIVASISLAIFGDPPRDTNALSMISAFLATSWLGVSVFQGDSVRDRIRFLADRGISPGTIWLTRHVYPLSILCLFVLVTVCWVSVVAGGRIRSLENIPQAALFLLAGAVIYLVSQWVAALISSPIVSAIAAPPVSFGAITFGVFLFARIGMPWWFGLLLIPIPAIATRVMTRRWMDRRLGFGYWAGHAAFIAALGILPAVSLMVTVMSQPAMPSEIARQLAAVSDGSLGYPATPRPLSLTSASDSLPAPDRWVDRFDQELTLLEDQLQSSEFPIDGSGLRVGEFARWLAVISRLSLERQPFDDSANDSPKQPADEDTQPANSRDDALAAITQRYRRSIGVLVEIARRMRLSPRLIEQDGADWIEIALLLELRRSDARERLGESSYRLAVRQIADRQGRSAARTRALVHSWRQFERESQHGTPSLIGGYRLPDFDSKIVTLRSAWVIERRVGRAIADLWELVRGGEQAATPERLAAIADFWNHGAPMAQLRADDLERFTYTKLSYPGHGVAWQWAADWERQAAELAH